MATGVFAGAVEVVEATVFVGAWPGTGTGTGVGAGTGVGLDTGFVAGIGIGTGVNVGPLGTVVAVLELGVDGLEGFAGFGNGIGGDCFFSVAGFVCWGAIEGVEVEVEVESRLAGVGGLTICGRFAS